MKALAFVAVVAALIVAGVLMLKSRSAKAAQPNAAGFPPEVVKRIEQERIARQQVQAADPEFFAAVSKLMFEHDPISINFGENTDEYEAEAGSVLPRLKSCASADDVTTIVHEEFQRWFGKDTAGDRSHYASLAKDIWGLWQRRGPNPAVEGTLRDKAAQRPSP
ncbi:hypothetical protein IAI53_07250 [Thauera sp. CAU 1555]|uniref:Uncharacterized protein n=1 Tax=Thauera sedimentorum TaxID=2767595 RepID=A0ABR9B8K0_9RHOO|nr:hypothetical protein [Thauera sedimentorum]MBC9071760.1 hypothetical protein [Thauera sedimentorum]MBD8502679.1 hypothetical protein [Thauera sedimentorum]